MKVTVEGVARVRRELDAAAAAATQAATRALREAAEAVQRDARGAVRVNTGALRDGIDVAYVDGGRTAEVGTRDPDLYYAAYEEFGTSNRPAHPFLRPAAERARTRLGRRVADRVKGELG